MKEILMVFLGSGIGGVCRYLVQLSLLKRSISPDFPFGTIAVNLVGSFLIGAAIGYLLNSSEYLKLLLITGFCGGFTTFSTFSLDSISLLKSGDYFAATLYIVGTFALCLIMTTLGIFLFKN